MTYYTPSNEHKTFIFALSTCVHCRRAKEFLDELRIAYGHVEVDILNDSDQDEALEEMGKYNPAQTFPTIIIGSRIIVGFKADDIRQALNKLRKV